MNPENIEYMDLINDMILRLQGLLASIMVEQEGIGYHAQRSLKDAKRSINDARIYISCDPPA